MQRKVKKSSGLYKFLEPVLEYGTPEEIAAARKEYNANRKKEWKKKNRKVFTITLTHQEEKEVAAAARKHHLHKTTFLKQAALGYLRNTYLAPDTEAILAVRQLLIEGYQSVLDQLEQLKLSAPLDQQILQRLSSLERQVLSCLLHPQTLEEQIQEAIKASPENRERLLSLIENAGSR